MAKFSGHGTNTLASTADTAFSLVGITATLRRAEVYEISMGDEGTPADNVLNHIIQRVTAEGTATAVTPSKLDQADGVSGMNAGENHTVEPTYTAAEELFETPLNNRGTYRRVSAPGSELITPAVNDEGIGHKAAHASATTDYGSQWFWTE